MNDRPLRSLALEFQEAGEDVLVHDPENRKIHVLNRTAAQVLQACDGRTTLRQIANRIGPHCPQRAYDDVVRIVAEFERLGLLSA